MLRVHNLCYRYWLWVQILVAPITRWKYGPLNGPEKNKGVTKLNTKNNFLKESTFFRKFVKTESNAGSLKKRMGSGRWSQDYKRIKKLHFHRFTLIDRSLSNWKVCFCCKVNKNVFAEIKFFTFTFVGKLFFTFTFSICDSDNNRYQI